MKQTAKKLNPSAIENTAWELFEVGSYEDVMRLCRNNPSSDFLNHLAIIAAYESGIRDTHEFIHLGLSPLSTLVESYRKYYTYQYKESAQLAIQYYKQPGSLISYCIVNFAVNATRNAGLFQEVSDLIQFYKKKSGDNSFLREEMEALFHLKKYAEFLKRFRESSSLLNDKEMHMMLGLSLYYIGKTTEATNVLESIPGKLTLPSFDEKKKSYSSTIAKIPELEKARDKMNHSQLAELGFAYLFNEDYRKAEEIFSKAIALAK